MTIIERMKTIKDECSKASKCVDCRFHSRVKYVNFGCPWKTALDGSVPRYWKPEVLEELSREEEAE